MIDFAEGKISVPDFLEYSKKHPEILDFLTNIADPKFKTTITHRKVRPDGFPEYIAEELPFNAKLFIDKELNESGGLFGKYLDIHGLLSNLLATAFPEDNITIDTTLHDKFSFMLASCPEYIEGE